MDLPLVVLMCSTRRLIEFITRPIILERAEETPIVEQVACVVTSGLPPSFRLNARNAGHAQYMLMLKAFLGEHSDITQPLTQQGRRDFPREKSARSKPRRAMPKP